MSFSTDRKVFLLICFVLLFLGGCANPQLVEKPTLDGSSSVCYQPICCSNSVALQFEPHRLNCQSIALTQQGKANESWNALQAAIVAAKAESVNKGPATEVLCFALNDAAHRADNNNNDVLSQSLFSSNYEACKARFGADSEPATEALYGTASQHLRRGRLAIAKSQMKQVLALTRVNKQPGLESFAIDALGRIADINGDRTNGRRLLQQAIAMKKSYFGERSSEVAVSYINLGASFIEANQGATGREWYRQAQSIYKETLGAYDDRTLNVGSALATSHLFDGEPQQAEHLYELLIPQFTQVYGATAERTVTLVNDLGVALTKQNRYAEALAFFEKTLTIRRVTIPGTATHGYSALNAAKMKKELAGCVASSDLNLEAVEIGRRLNSRSHTEKEVAEFIADLTEFEKECDKRHVTTSILEQKQPDLLLRQKQIEALERQIEIDSIAFEKRARRKFVGGTIANPELNDYVKTCWGAVERHGAKYYPSKSVKGLRGKIQVLAEFQSDGKLKSYEIAKSSGVPAIDSVTKEILSSFSYCPPFPETIKAEIDILSLVKTFTYRQYETLVTNNPALWGEYVSLFGLVDAKGTIKSLERPKTPDALYANAADALLGRQILFLARPGQTGQTKREINIKFVENDQAKGSK